MYTFKKFYLNACLIITVMKKIILFIIQCFFPSVCTVADPDLQIRGGHPDPEIRGGPGLPQIFFGPLGLILVKKWGGGEGSPWIHHCCNPTTIHYTLNICWQVIEHTGSL